MLKQQYEVKNISHSHCMASKFLLSITLEDRPLKEWRRVTEGG
jgi:hypothetical protein